MRLDVGVMVVGAPPSSGQGITPYQEHRDYVLGVLARRCGWLDPADRESLLHEAYAVFLHKQRAGQLDVATMRPPQVRAYLTQTALNKAMDEGKRVGRRRSVSLDDEDLGIEPADPGAALDEQLAARFDDARVREIVAQLPERQQMVIKLRFFFSRTPQEIQQFMGITERVYRREMERATRQLAERFEQVRNGTFCESRRSLILAYVTGVAGPNRRRDAHRHLASCPACASWAAQMRSATHRAAAVAPMPLVTLPLKWWSVGHARLTADGARQRAVDLLAGARDHWIRALVRVDPSRVAAFSGARPSAAAMLVTGCLAAGSTATYCVVDGLPAPISSLVDSFPTHDAARHHAPDETRRTTATIAVRAHKPVTPSGADPMASLGARHVNHSASPPVSPRRVAQRPSSAAARNAAAQQTEKATAPEFGLGDASSSSPASHNTSTSAVDSVASRASAATGDPSAPSGGAAPPPTPSKPLPEFDP